MAANRYDKGGLCLGHTGDSPQLPLWLCLGSIFSGISTDNDSISVLLVAYSKTSFMTLAKWLLDDSETNTFMVIQDK